MTISAKRFSFLDNETNLAVSNFQNITAPAILNSPNNELDLITQDLASFVSNSKQSLTGILPAVENITLPKELSPDLIREVKGMFPSMQDISGLNVKQIGDMVADLLPGDPRVQSAFNQINRRCSTKALGTGALGKPYNPSLNCNNRARSGKGGLCNSSAANNLFNTLSGGSYNSVMRDLNNLIKKIIGLATFGYDMNLCGVWNVLSQGVDKYIQSRAAGGLLSVLAGSRNTAGIIDVASNLTGLPVLLENPSAISATFNNFGLPADLKEVGYSQFSDALTESVEVLSSTWNVSPRDNIVSTREMDTFDPKLNRVFKSKLMDNIFQENDLTVAPTGNFLFMAAAYNSKDTSKFKKI